MPASLISTKKADVAGTSLWKVLVGLYRQLSPAMRRSFPVLLAVMLLGAVAEVVTIGALLPFLAAIADSENSPVLSFIAPALTFLGADDQAKAIYVLTALFALAAIVAAALRLLLLWMSQNFLNGISYELSIRLYTNALYESYAYHIRRNSSDTIAAINKVEIVTGYVIGPLMQATIAFVLASFIIVGLVAIDATVALVAGVGFSAIYLLATALTRSRLKRNSAVVSRAHDRRVKTMQEGLGGIRDVLLDQSQPVFLETYERVEAGYRTARARTSFLGGAPRFIVEAVGMIVIALVAVTISQRPGGLMGAIPVLGALALGAQRLLPLIQQIYSGWAQVMGHQQVLFDVAAMLSRPAPERIIADMSLPFENQIRLNNVGFAYSEGRTPALNGVSLEIPRGARVGIVGKTGSGKSTLMDLVIGLLEPTQGDIFIDGVKLTSDNRAAWQKNIAHVPQAIYLSDASIAENIAFGVRPDEIDRERVRRAAEQAELGQVIAALPQGYDTYVGERGIQLSGGQRQRIGIARALYKQASVLVFDEATSALDNETESAVMAAVERLDRNLTILLIAHRISTLDGCDMIVRLEGGRMVHASSPLEATTSS
ncbi:MAG: ABC transporter ATP-binding protein [Pseudochelatococcus sp.]|jgi:ABC-type bacteriocin/lantibiotic exporter with double-glycine peptidase domain|uniref:ABC transporter ATP-binding protein n=1 Tax=Pseudochelatococcus sp. TaxID=2020869 RepID=UPI003D8B1659